MEKIDARDDDLSLPRTTSLLNNPLIQRLLLRQLHKDPNRHGTQSGSQSPRYLINRNSCHPGFSPTHSIDNIGSVAQRKFISRTIIKQTVCRRSIDTSVESRAYSGDRDGIGCSASCEVQATDFIGESPKKSTPSVTGESVCSRRSSREETLSRDSRVSRDSSLSSTSFEEACPTDLRKIPQLKHNNGTPTRSQQFLIQGKEEHSDTVPRLNLSFVNCTDTESSCLSDRANDRSARLRKLKIPSFSEYKARRRKDPNESCLGGATVKRSDSAKAAGEHLARMRAKYLNNKVSPRLSFDAGISVKGFKQFGGESSESFEENFTHLTSELLSKARAEKTNDSPKFTKQTHGDITRSGTDLQERIPDAIKIEEPSQVLVRQNAVDLTEDNKKNHDPGGSFHVDTSKAKIDNKDKNPGSAGLKETIYSHLDICEPESVCSMETDSTAGVKNGINPLGSDRISAVKCSKDTHVAQAMRIEAISSGQRDLSIVGADTYHAAYPGTRTSLNTKGTPAAERKAGTNNASGSSVEEARRTVTNTTRVNKHINLFDCTQGFLGDFSPGNDPSTMRHSSGSNLDIGSEETRLVETSDDSRLGRTGEVPTCPVAHSQNGGTNDVRNHPSGEVEIIKSTENVTSVPGDSMSAAYDHETEMKSEQPRLLLEITRRSESVNFSASSAFPAQNTNTHDTRSSVKNLQHLPTRKSGCISGKFGDNESHGSDPILHAIAPRNENTTGEVNASYKSHTQSAEKHICTTIASTTQQELCLSGNAFTISGSKTSLVTAKQTGLRDCDRTEMVRPHLATDNGQSPRIKGHRLDPHTQRSDIDSEISDDENDVTINEEIDDIFSCVERLSTELSHRAQDKSGSFENAPELLYSDLSNSRSTSASFTEKVISPQLCDQEERKELTLNHNEHVFKNCTRSQENAIPLCESDGHNTNIAHLFDHVQHLSNELSDTSKIIFPCRESPTGNKNEANVLKQSHDRGIDKATGVKSPTEEFSEAKLSVHETETEVSDTDPEVKAKEEYEKSVCDRLEVLLNKNVFINKWLTQSQLKESHKHGDLQNTVSHTSKTISSDSCPGKSGSSPERGSKRSSSGAKRSNSLRVLAERLLKPIRKGLKNSSERKDESDHTSTTSDTVRAESEKLQCKNEHGLHTFGTDTDSNDNQAMPDQNQVSSPGSNAPSSHTNLRKRRLALQAERNSWFLGSSTAQDTSLQLNDSPTYKTSPISIRVESVSTDRRSSTSDRDNSCPSSPRHQLGDDDVFIDNVDEFRTVVSSSCSNSPRGDEGYYDSSLHESCSEGKLQFFMRISQDQRSVDDPSETSVSRSISDVSDMKSEESRKKGTRERRQYRSDPFYRTDSSPGVQNVSLSKKPESPGLLQAPGPVKLADVPEESLSPAPKKRFSRSSRQEILSFLEDARRKMSVVKAPSLVSLASESIETEAEWLPWQSSPSQSPLPRRRTGLSHILYTQEHMLNDQDQNTLTVSQDDMTDTEAMSEMSLDITKPGNLLICRDCEKAFQVNMVERSDEGVLCKKCVSNRLQRKETIQEILSTEISYGKDMKIMKEEFYNPIQTAGLLTEDQLAAIFLNLDDLIRVNHVFTDRLQSSLDNAHEIGDDIYATVEVGDLFLRSAELFRTFETYCVNQNEAQMCLQQLAKEKELLKIFLQVSQTENSLLRRMGLKSFLMTPVQRIMKYPLLLQRVYKATPIGHRDMQSIPEARQKLETILDQINSKARSSRLYSSVRKRLASQGSVKKTAPAEYTQLSKVGLDSLGWSPEESRIVLSGKLLYYVPQDHNWARKLKLLKFTNIHALIIVQGEWKPPRQRRCPDPTCLKFPEMTSVQQAALLLVREKNSKYTLLRDPLKLDRTVVSVTPGKTDVIEIQDISRDAILIKSEDSTEMAKWVSYLTQLTRDLGQWRRRRNGMPNIMLK